MGLKKGKFMKNVLRKYQYFWKIEQFHYFSVTWIFREINFRDCRSSKLAIFEILDLEALYFKFCYISAINHCTNSLESKLREPLKLCKWPFLNVYNPQNWFHVKSRWQKITEISALRSFQNCWPILNGKKLNSSKFQAHKIGKNHSQNYTCWTIFDFLHFWLVKPKCVW